MSDKLKILNICSDFPNQPLYAQLANAIDSLNIDQHFYVPVRTEAEANYAPPHPLNSTYVAENILRPWHRIFFGSKVRLISKMLSKSFDPSSFSLSHAHFLYSDGAVALRLKQEYDLDYVVAVRNTDINSFMKLRPDLKSHMLRIIQSARRIIFLNPAYEESFLKKIGKFRENVEKKTSIVPNGLDEPWFVKRDMLTRSMRKRILYVGDFTTNKNVPALIQAVAGLSDQFEIALTLVGGGGNSHKTVLQTISDFPHVDISFLGHISRQEDLRDIYRQHDVFVMASHRETFGLTYIEALSQGVPVVHSMGQGIAGLIDDEKIVKAVDPMNTGSIKNAIRELLLETTDVRNRCIRSVDKFRWIDIARQYQEIYQEAASG